MIDFLDSNSQHAFTLKSKTERKKTLVRIGKMSMCKGLQGRVTALSLRQVTISCCNLTNPHLIKSMT